jgi:hypothetical protein
MNNYYKLGYKAIVGFSGLGFLALFLSFYSREIVTNEDGLIEWTSALAHLFSSITALILYKWSKYKWISIFWILFSFVCFGEEISWLQRQIQYSIPEIENQNSQREVNFHNLKIFGNERIVSEDGKVGLNYKIFFSTQILFQMGMVVYFLIIPVLSKFSHFFQGTFPTFSHQFLWTFWLLVTLSFVLSMYQTFNTRNTYAETRECLYAVFIFLHQPLLLNSRKS